MLANKFEAQALETPGNIAVKSGPEVFTYGELNRYAGAVARRISDIASGENVALLFEHGAHMIAAVLGALKAGKTYVPLPVDYPPNRISYMLTDSESSLIVTNAAGEPYARRLSEQTGIPVLDISRVGRDEPGDISSPAPDGDKTAYILYTSGSTGRPKGVLQTHRNVDYFIRHWLKMFSVTPSDRMTLLASFCHDASVMDIFSALHAGAALLPLNMKDRDNTVLLSDFLNDEKITIWHSVPSLFSFFAGDLTGEERFPDLRFIILGGEAVRRHEAELLNKHFPHSVMANIYGQTESSVNSVCFIRPGQSYNKSLIGAPLDETRVFVIDAEGSPADPLEPGEILTASPYISPGYWRNPEASEAAFDYDDDLGNLYWTGDLGRLLPDGGIEFLGRRDHQVKIRGFRIEAGEIETQLLKHPRLKEAVIMVREDESGDKYLAAYITSTAGTDKEMIEISQLREFLARELPDYMVPPYFQILDKMPLTPTGKIDRKALPEPGLMVSREEYIAPANDIEKKLAEIWAEVLKLETGAVGIDSDFFRLGGHSLRATIVVSKVHKAFDVRVPLAAVFKAPTIRRLAQYISDAGKDIFQSIEPAPKKEYYPLSPAQKRLFILYQMDPAVSVYNMPVAIILEGKTTKMKLEEAFRQLIARHDSLRTSFQRENGAPVQRIHDAVDFEIVGLRGEASASLEKTVKDFVRPFDLSRAPLLRVGLLEIREQKYLLAVDMHHIISDGSSMDLVVKELMTLYQGKELPPLSIQYKDYSEWRNRELERESYRSQEAYWLKRFPEAPSPLELPLDFPRPAVRDFEGERLSFESDAETLTALNRLARRNGTTLYMVLLGIFSVFISKLCGRDDIVIGAPIAGRRHEALNPIVGMFVNTLVLRSYPHGDKTFDEFLKETTGETLAAFENQEYPFESLVEKAVTQHDAGRNPMFDVAFLLQNVETTQAVIPGLKMSRYPIENTISKFDFSLQAGEFDSRSGVRQLVFVFEYRTKLFKAETIERFIGYFKRVLSLVLRAPGEKISQMALIPEEEKRRILDEFNDTAVDYPRDKTIHQLFEEQAAKAGDKIALVAHGAPSTEHEVEAGRLTYRELNRKADDLASIIINKGAAPGDIVAIMGERSIDMVVGILGVLKTGSAYLPIDMDYPEERKRYMLADSNAKIMLTEGENPLSRVSELSRDIEIIHLDELHKVPGDSHTLHSTPNTQHLSSSPAYIMYTSGSTGRPKGVLVTHRNVVRLVKNNTFVPLSEETRILQTGAPVFDAVTFEMWGGLLNGGRLILAAKEVVVDALRLGGVLSEHRVNTLWLSAALFNQLMQQDIEIFEPLTYLLVGGDVLSPPHINRVRERFPDLHVINGYGPTENTTFSTTHLIDKTYEHSIPIGQPIGNSTAYIVDSVGAPQPVGVWGELLVGGDGVALGYLNNPELTAERFGGGAAPSFNKTHKSYRTYRTGDLARYLPDGVIRFKGRIDQQVKIRGFRIELEEIEQQLLGYEEIKEAVVTAHKDERGDKFLVAYLTSGAEKDNRQTLPLRVFLLEKLPDYMIPSYFLFLDKMPLTPNGKINRKALPEPGVCETGEDTTGAGAAAPRDELEKEMARVWAEVLAVDEAIIGIDTSFPHLGGHSLKAVMLASRMHETFGVEISLREILQTATIRALARIIRRREKTAFTEPGSVENKEYYPLSFNQQRMYILHQLNPGSPAYNMPMQLSLEREVDEFLVRKTLETLTARHESLRTGFKVVAGVTVQFIAEILELPFRFVDISSQEGEAKQRERDRLRREINGAPFGLETFPLFRAALVKLESRRYEFLFNIHHILCDGWSLTLLRKEFIQLYDADGNDIAAVPSPALRYRDYCHWHHQRLTPANPHQKSPAAAYWEEKLTGGFPVIRLPYDFQKADCVGGRAGGAGGAGYRYAVDEALKDDLLQLAERRGATLFSVMFSVYLMLMSRLSGSGTVGCSVIVAGRTHASFRDVTGLFVNSILLKTGVNNNENFKDFLERLNRDVLEAFQHQDHPMESVFEALNMRYPEVPVSFNMLNLPDAGAGRLMDSPQAFHLEHKQDIKFDMEPYITEYRDGIDIRWVYRKSRFKPGSVEQMVNRYVDLLRFFADNPEQSLKGRRATTRKSIGRGFGRN